MISFDIWMEYREKDFTFYKNLILNRLNLDRSEGMSSALSTFQKDKLESLLQGLGEFKKLPDVVQKAALGRVASGDGTVGDLIRTLASDPDDITSGGD